MWKNQRNQYLAVVVILLAAMLLGSVPVPRTVMAQSTESGKDLGDAPDSSNNFGKVMEAYPGVIARFPTVHKGPVPYGPLHQNARILYTLGAGISAEEEADIGVDADGVTNLDPTAGISDRDGSDDGLTLPDELEHCQLIQLDYTVVVPANITLPATAFFNLWMDWNRDGNWAEVHAAPARCGELAYAPEWAVDNQVIHLNGSGTYHLSTPPLRVWNPSPGKKMWARITLSDTPVTKPDGSGPAGGWDYGETEDYLIPGQDINSLLPPAPPLPPTIPPVFTSSPRDFEVTGIEVSQGIQDLGNGMPLVANRRTIVRVYAREKTGHTVANVKASLSVTGSYPGGGFGFNLFSEPTTVFPDGGDRLNYDHSFNFELPEGINLSEAGVVSFQANVNWDHGISENNFSDNESEKVIRSMFPANPLRYYFVPVHLHDPAPDEDTEVDPNSPVHDHHFMDGAMDLKTAYNALRYHPIGGGIVSDEGLLIDWTNIPVYPINHNLGVEWNLRRGVDRTAVNERLATIKALENDPYTIYYGMVDPAGFAGPYAGWANKGVAWGKFSDSVSVSSPWRQSAGSILSHESGHRRGLGHMLCKGNEASGGGVDPNYPWPIVEGVSPCSLAEINPNGYFGLDVYHTILGFATPIVISNDPALAQPNRGFPMMGYQGPQWVSPYEFCKLMPKYGIPCAIDWTLDDLTWFADNVPEVDSLFRASEYLWIGGLLNLDTSEVELSPFYRMADPPDHLLDEALQRRWDEAENGQRTEWTVALKNLNGKNLYEQTIFMDGHGDSPDDDQEGELNHGPQLIALNDLLPFPPGTSSVEVLHNGVMVAQKQMSSAPPQVTILSPNGGEQLTAGSEISWQGSDPDGDDLFYTVAYSNDGGSRWIIVALEIPETKLTVDSELLSSLAGSDQALFKVIVTDGINTAEDISDAVFTTPNNPPAAVILLPEEPATGVFGELISFTGAGLDQEDGELDDAQLSWQSDLDGDLGSGHEFTTGGLSPGIHTITLTVTDSQGAADQASIQVDIQALLYLPMATR